MSEKETGGSAYPLENAGTEFQRGMTLRDYFAGQALVGIVNVFASTDGVKSESMAGAAYQIADYMLEARK